MIPKTKPKVRRLYCPIYIRDPNYKSLQPLDDGHTQNTSCNTSRNTSCITSDNSQHSQYPSTCACCLNEINISTTYVQCSTNSHAICDVCQYTYITKELDANRATYTCAGHAFSHCMGHISTHKMKQLLNTDQWKQFCNIKEKKSMSQISSVVNTYYICSACQLYGQIVHVTNTQHEYYCPSCDNTCEFKQHM